jgi:hypothetical protein
MAKNLIALCTRFLPPDEVEVHYVLDNAHFNSDRNRKAKKIILSASHLSIPFGFFYNNLCS